MNNTRDSEASLQISLQSFALLQFSDQFSNFTAKAYRLSSNVKTEYRIGNQMNQLKNTNYQNAGL
jgi:hypothetical protein